MNSQSELWHGTTILTVRKGASSGRRRRPGVDRPDHRQGQRQEGRRLGKGDVIGGFAGATADASRCSSAWKPSWNSIRAN